MSLRSDLEALQSLAEQPGMALLNARLEARLTELDESLRMDVPWEGTIELRARRREVVAMLGKLPELVASLRAMLKKDGDDDDD